ncbi:MAG TPA: hypothetical protein VFU02_02980 [Polyangiaceae bacterium]|nr:hypothetical protein [Polyangiaceae bacterium]
MIISYGMGIATAIVLSIVVLLCCRLAGWLLRTTLPIAAPVAFCALVALETLIMNVLSVFRWVTASGIFVSHALVALGGIAVVHRTGQLSALFDVSKLRRRLAWALRSPTLPYLLPIAVVLFLVAIVYPPNNYDSLTYHMTRVAFWLQNRSVDFYATVNPRQNGTCPGAEYLILTLQALTGGDRLANCVQTTAFAIILVSIALITRYLKAPRAFRVPLVVVCCTAPSFVLQATTTQNDLCAAVTVLAVLCAARRVLFGREVRLTLRDAGALSLSLAAAYMVKPTALVLTTPLLAVVAWRILRALMRRRQTPESLATLRALGLALIVAVGICGPHLARIANEPDVLAPTANLMFPGSKTGLTQQRLLNPLLAVAHHVPPTGLDRWLGKIHASARPTSAPSSQPWWLGGFYAGHALRQHEDLAGAPFQFIALALSSVIGLAWATRRRASGRSIVVLLALLPPVTWLFFHWVAKNNQWIARYHAPWLTLGVIGALGACELARSSRAGSIALTTGAWALAVPALVYAWSTIIANELRPVSTKALQNLERLTAYYAHAPELKSEHDRVLALLETRSCRQLVLALGSDDAVEYPLTWRAVQAGVRVSHRPGPADACLLYAPLGLHSAAWKPVKPGEKKVYVPKFP